MSPHFSWANIPQETKSLIVMAFDKDIPLRGLSLFTWIHWLVYDILPEIMELDEGFPNNASFENGTKQGITTFRKPGYGGPCPPFGTHRYFFRVLAIALNLKILQPCPYTPFRRNHRFFLKSFAARRGSLLSQLYETIGIPGPFVPPSVIIEDGRVGFRRDHHVAIKLSCLCNQ